MKIILALSLLFICAPVFATSPESVEATTAITLPVDTVTIYPDGLMAAKLVGPLEVTIGQHKFVMNVPDSVDKSSILLNVSNATIEGLVYDGNPIYTLDVSNAGSQKFILSYLMPNSASWEPRYDLHISNDTALIKSNAAIKNFGGED